MPIILLRPKIHVHVIPDAPEAGLGRIHPVKLLIAEVSDIVLLLLDSLEAVFRHEHVRLCADADGHRASLHSQALMNRRFRELGADGTR